MATWKGLQGDLVEVDETSAHKYKLMGYAPAPQKDLDHEALRKSYDHWYLQPLAAGAGIVAGIPGLTAATSAVAGALGQAENFQQNMAGLESAFPVTSTVGQGAGMVGTAAVLSALAPVGMAAGLAAPMASATFLGSAATLAAVAGAENAAMGLGYKFDQAAIEHANTPEGFDKIFANVGMDTLADFALGAAFGGAGAVLPKAFKTVSRASQKWGEANMVESVLGAEKYQELERAGKSTPVAQWLNANDLLGTNPKKAAAKVAGIIDNLGPKFNEIKGMAEVPLPATQQVRFEQSMNEILGAEFPITDLNKGYTVERLHQVRDALDGRINWKNLEHPFNAKLNQARDVVDNYLNNLFELNDMAKGGALANEWKALNHEYSMANLVRDALSKGVESSEAAWWKKPATLFLGASLGPGAAKLLAAGVATAEAYKAGRFGYLAKKLGQVFEATSDGLAKAVQHGFYGLGPLSGQRPADASSFELKAAQLRHVASAPEAMEKMGTALLEQGYPQDVVDQMIQRQVQLAQVLLDKAPKNPYAATVASAPWSPSEDARDNWAELYNTAHDIKHWITDPSPEKTQIAELAFPALVQRTRDIVLEQVSTLNDIPMESRVWASNILRAPVEPLMDPASYAILSMARMQEGTPVPDSGSSSSSESDVIESEQTSFERLQNRA